MRLIYFISVLPILAATVAAAQDLVYSDVATDSCLAEGGEMAACAGLSASQCMMDTPGGYSTYGESGCLDAEWQYWDRMLNANYKDRMAKAQKDDLASEGFGESRADALKAMQRAWIVYRDAKCDYERSQWGGGTGGGPATLSCHLHETASQALFLGVSEVN